MLSVSYAEDSSNLYDNTLDEEFNEDTIDSDIPIDKTDFSSIIYTLDNNDNQYDDLEQSENILEDEVQIDNVATTTSTSSNTPKVTVNNITEIRDNFLNITMSSNVNGIIYYTRNGSMPNSNSKIYTNGQILKISVKTQINAIVITNNGVISSVTHYQAEQIITPPVSVVVPLTDLVDGKQTITFSTNWNNTTTYYTTDGSNPKKSNTTKVYNNKSFSLSKYSILKYYTKDNREGYPSAVYNYTTPSYSGERPTLTIYNTTRMYSNNVQRVMIQSNQPTTIEYYRYWGKNKVIHKKYVGEIETTKNSQLIVTGKHKQTKEMASSIEYMPTKGARTIMNYTYTLGIPYQNGTVYINRTDGIRLNNAYSLFKSGEGILYNNRTQNVTISKNMAITEPGLLVYTDNNLNTLYIKYYGYVYGDVNQVSVISTTDLLDDFSLPTSFYVVVNGKIQNMTHIILNEMKYLSSKTPITTSFTSNFLNYTLDKKDYLNPYFTDDTMIPFQTLQSYVLTNRIITKTDMIQWMAKNTTYNTTLLKSTYGTFLTGLTTLYLNDEVSKYYGKHTNITFTRGQDTQVLIGVNSRGRTYSNIYDPTVGIVLTNQPNINQTITFRFITTTMLVEWERQAIRLSGQNVSSSSYLFYKDINLEQNNIKIILDEENGILTIEPISNATYYITIDLETGITKIIMNTEEEDLIKGTLSFENQGYCYHEDRSNILNDYLNQFFGFLNSDISHQIFQDIEGMIGSGAISAGMLVALLGVSGGSILAPVLIVGGVGTCLHSVGVNNLHKFSNLYYWAEAAPSLISGFAVMPEIRAVSGAAKLVKIGHMSTYGTKYAVTIGMGSAVTSADSLIIEKYEDDIITEPLKKFLRFINVPGEEELEAEN
ncbi:chitobiase/beta-hexosaminidase C-terminal domain-containing protein [Methanosphaera sp. WGK6]|uniref:chitobiase/beta-hexosaminidase C-terminal domain-containing protein n=1 Tax=Methanosphaera sp. WGK6 TaxID=1561964 RepID=UPI00084C0668|nr:chitobiase/beta-hexosaminidase C-terminal domain-containing protein [Methanosphaera sp. WGK6]OED30379.1 hypothetical protein NL43_03125 [Methanosphaera sp. WGK6]